METNTPRQNQGQRAIKNITTGRRTRENVWGNTYGYIGCKRVMDFGTDTYDTTLWRDDPAAYDELQADEKRIQDSFITLRPKS